ncbi:hydrogen peroxide-inducible genes activator [Cyclobacterium marinum]|uniref:Transcriptional regulator, LysR family n=1 Tax=Cyclobacterium marinum (strain ATCC 25205 / DSM 745 / LMG 13164 / NCIMB 1802) TaxID=880070 RepID=G0IUT1_CYCMS|nr:hydrogen peroxide-inducible genes activator [Cyclobacterium marinum]AEL25473.1 transcriptional regulator, LysR family [Cyclobacterium marinum DSM 745]MBI0400912.1 hydrogen peroxide-inducible genes activator [Cyclobacterium marinum]|tara:strand:+ start:60624 stop:61559 length:936 start_codon:yes stop_codon:yes gene_type:complete
MTIQQLEYILAVEKFRHFGQAADACFVTQPTLSAQISKLERELDILLFDRSKMPVIPTEIGEKVIAQAKRVVMESKGLLELVAEMKGEIGGTIKVGIIPTLAPNLLPLFIGNFIEKYPNVLLEVQEMVTEEILSRLKNDELDLGIVVSPLHEGGMVEKPIFYEKFFVYLSKDHPLLNQKEIPVADLPAEDLWVLQQGHCFRDQVLNLCDKNVFQRKNFHYESGSIEGLKNMVDRYMGITLLPELATDNLSKEEKTRLRPFSGNPPVREISLIRTRNFLKQRLVNLLFEEIKASMPAHMQSNKDGRLVNFKL